MLKEITNSLKVTLYERSSNPLFGSLIVSFLVLHWRIPLGLLHENPHKAVTDAIAHDFSQNIGWSLVALLFSAILASLAFPLAGWGLARLRAPMLRLARQAHKLAHQEELLSKKQGEDLKKLAQNSEEMVSKVLTEKSELSTQLNSAQEALRKLTQEQLEAANEAERTKPSPIQHTVVPGSEKQENPEVYYGALTENNSRAHVLLYEEYMAILREKYIAAALKLNVNFIVPSNAELTDMKLDDIESMLRAGGMEVPHLSWLPKPPQGAVSGWKSAEWKNRYTDLFAQLEKFNGA